MSSIRSAPPRAPRAALLTGLLLAALGGPTAAAQTGSGTVAFTFLGFSGPFAVSTQAEQGNPAVWTITGQVNGVTPTGTGWAPSGPPTPGALGYVTGATTFAAPVSEVALRYTYLAPGAPGGNLIRFASRPFTNVAVGQDFILGTLTFENGFWTGGGNAPGYNTPTDLAFRLTTTSADGAAFNQTITGNVRMVVNQIPTEAVTLAEQQAEADWIYVDSPAVAGSMGAFRVYDNCCRPAGFTNVGTVDVVARFNSLDLVGLANPSGGFVTPGVGPLPPAPLATVPEPGTWALAAAGAAALGAWRRRAARA